MTQPKDLSARQDTGLTVSLSLLDTLMTLAGELVLSRNQLLQGISGANMKIIEQSGQRIDLITSELQEAVMRTRMQPISSLFDRCEKTIRDLARQQDKQVDLNIGGSEVELDKTILEAIGTPLEKLSETCVTRGIEALGERRAAGKDETGQISLNAFHDAGQVHIELMDDGSGTAHDDLVPDIEAAIKEIGGVPEFESTPGKGSRVKIKLPLTLAIIPSQIASVGEERYAIPQSNLGELIRVPAAEIKERIEKVGDAEVVRLREELLPLVNLSRMLDIPTYYQDPATGNAMPERRQNMADRRANKYAANGARLQADEQEGLTQWQKREGEDRRQGSAALNIAVVFAGNFKYGLVIDRLHDSEEIVVKPVGRHLKESMAFSGATIMGDGKVALILDILNIAQMADLSSRSEAASLLEAVEQTGPGTGTEDNDLVIFRNQDSEYFAAPLAAVQRIEKLPTAQIEQVGNQRVVQYRGGALPLFELSQALDVKPLPEKQDREVIVFSIMEKEMGIMVSPPVDTVKRPPVEMDTTLTRPGVSGSLVINDKTTLLLDLNQLAGLI